VIPDCGKLPECVQAGLEAGSHGVRLLDADLEQINRQIQCRADEIGINRPASRRFADQADALTVWVDADRSTMPNQAQSAVSPNPAPERAIEVARLTGFKNRGPIALQHPLWLECRQIFQGLGLLQPLLQLRQIKGCDRCCWP